VHPLGGLDECRREEGAVRLVVAVAHRNLWGRHAALSLPKAALQRARREREQGCVPHQGPPAQDSPPAPSAKSVIAHGHSLSRTRSPRDQSLPLGSPAPAAGPIPAVTVPHDRRTRSSKLKITNRDCVRWCEMRSIRRSNALGAICWIG